MAPLTVATKEIIAGIFDGAAATYDRVGPAIFTQFGERLVALLDVTPGARVLDVATGTGAALLPAARRAGPTGHVTGIDLSAAILVEAGRAAEARGLRHITLRQMDAEHLAFPDGSFDAVTCAFGLFFFPDMAGALAEMRRVCATTGRLGVTLFNRTPPPFDPGWPILAQQVQALAAGVRLPQRVAYTPAEVEALLSKAGFRAIHCHEERYDIVFPDEEAWWAFQLTLGSRATILALAPETRANFKETYLTRLRPLFQSDGLHLAVGVIYALGR